MRIKVLENKGNHRTGENIYKLYILTINIQKYIKNSNSSKKTQKQSD